MKGAYAHDESALPTSTALHGPLAWHCSERLPKRNMLPAPLEADGEGWEFGFRRLEPFVGAGSGFRMKPHRCGALFLILNLINRVNTMSRGEKGFSEAASGLLPDCTVLSCGSLLSLTLFQASAWGAFKSQSSACRASLFLATV